MALEIDGLAVLRAIAEAPEAFPAIRGDVTKAAHALVSKQLKARNLGVEGLGKVAGALGSQALALILDGLKDAEVRSLAGRLDKHHPDLEQGTPAAHRRHVLALATGTAPAGKPKPAPKARAPRAAGRAAPAP
ncbi:hypothetical protein, partial [Methylobacterium crusticola]